MRVDVGDCYARSNCMQGALPGRLSMTVQTCKIQKHKVPKFHILFNMFFEQTYMKDGVARAELAILPLTLSCSAVRSRTSF